MKYFLIILLCVLKITANGQSISSLNLSYQYNPQNEISFELYSTKDSGRVQIYYTLKPTGAQFKLEDYTISWEQRESFNQREGTTLTPEESLTRVGDGEKSARLSFPMPTKPWLLVARVKNNTSSDSWIYLKTIEAKFPVNGYLQGPTRIISKPFVPVKTEFDLHAYESQKPVYVSYYKESFLPASPPFVESETKVDRFLLYDSSFVFPGRSKISLPAEGLYLFQQDTVAEEGFCYRGVPASFPKYTRIEDLIKPMIYISTREEYDLFKAANGDKVKFDKIILDITGDKNRAKNFIRSYFHRIELANLYFSSYKEGWKTDRGMIYLIFGLPNEVSFNGTNEVWRYKTFKESFTFVKTGSVYGPDYFVLIRDRRFMETWFNTIDLWRKSRF